MSNYVESCPPSVDNSFGPWAGTCRGGFDFTLLFEECILAIPVQCVFLLVLPFRLADLARTEQKVVDSPLKFYKPIVAFCLVAFQLAALLRWATSSSVLIEHTRATIPTAALEFTASLGICVLSWYEHTRSVRPSFVIDIYLLLSILFDATRSRTLWLLNQDVVIPAIFTCTVGLRCVLLLFESTEKRTILKYPFREYSREETSGTFSRSVFFWLTKLFLNGYSKVLTLKDLFPLDQALGTERLQRNLQLAWDKVPNKSKPNALMNTWLKVHSRPLLAAVFPRLCQTGFNFAQPFLVTRGIELASSPKVQPYNNIGYGLIGAYVLVYVGMAVSNGQYEHKMYRSTVMMRGSLIPCIYRKTLLLDSAQVKSAAALTLMSTDIENIATGIPFMQELWAGVLEIALATYLLGRQAGAACAVPIGFAIFVMIATIFIAVPTGKSRADWIAASQKRVATTSTALSNMKWLKLSNLDNTMFSMIHQLRSDELKTSQRYRALLLGIVTIGYSSPVMSLLLTFITFAGLSARTGGDVTISKIFTSLALFALLNKPLTMNAMVLPYVAGAIASFNRIQEYLNIEVKKDKRLTSSTAAPTQDIFETSSGIELTNLQRSMTSATTSTSIVFMNGRLQWPETSRPVIDIRSWAIKSRTFTLLLGPVGCGKSTLLKCLLGELSDFEGDLITFYSGVAYCEQTPWLPNESVRNIILGTTAYDDRWYDQVVQTCALGQDILQWANGDQIVVGSKGISLSGGQKQRVAIARAVYARKEFIVLDDVFSGLDQATEDIVFRNLLGEQGLLRRSDMTVVLASSDVRRAPFADSIVILDDSGMISDHGSFEAVRHGNGLERVKFSTKTTRERSSDLSYTLPKSVEQVFDDLELQTDQSRRVGDSAVYKYYLASAGWRGPVIYLAAMSLYAFCDSFPNIWLKWWADANAVMPNSDLGKWLGVYAALGAGAITGLLGGVGQMFMSTIVDSGVYFHNLLAEIVSKAPISFFTSVDNGITINRFSQDLALIDMDLPAAAIGTSLTLVLGIAQAVMVIIASKYIAVVFPFVFIAFYFLQAFYLRTSRQMRFLDIEHKAPLYSQMMETLSGLATIRAFQWEDQSRKKNREILDDSQRPFYLLYCLQRWLNFSVDMVSAFIAVILITITVTLRDKIGPGYMGIALVNIISFNATMKGMILSWVTLEVSIGAVARVKAFVMNTRAEGDTEGPREEPVQPWPRQGRIEIRNLTASYEMSGPVLKNITISIKPREKVGICGRTGSGKSSLVSCFFQLLDIDHGSIEIDGVDLSGVTHQSTRSNLVIVPQEALILDGTVRLNLDSHNSASDDEIIQALEKVQLWPMIEQRGGLETVVDGKFFSQGQAQLFCLARAMLRKSKVLILDEVTSSLDSSSSAIVKGIVQTWFADWTVISIAHKLDSILDFDQVAVLDKGELVEYGNPRMLLSRQSRFRDLHEYS